MRLAEKSLSPSAEGVQLDRCREGRCPGSVPLGKIGQEVSTMLRWIGFLTTVCWLAGIDSGLSAETPPATEGVRVLIPWCEFPVSDQSFMSSSAARCCTRKRPGRFSDQSVRAK